MASSFIQLNIMQNLVQKCIHPTNMKSNMYGESIGTGSDISIILGG